MKLKQAVLVLTLVGGLVGGQRAVADDTSDAIQALRKQIEELDQKVRVLERQKELDVETADAKAKDAPRITLGNTGLNISSGDSNFVFGLHGFLQVDNRTFLHDNKGLQGNDTFLIRRARPIFSGTLYRDFDFLFVPDFGGSTVQIFDAYLNYRYKPWLQLRAGKFKVPIGLEQLQSDPVTLFNERGLPSTLMPNRDVGFQFWGEVAKTRLTYQLGVFNGVGDGRSTANSDFEDHREFAGRLFLQPFKGSKLTGLAGLGFGVGGSWGTISSNATGLTAGYLTAGQQTFFSYTNNTVGNGEHWRISPQACYYYGPFSLLGEYVISEQKVSRTVAPIGSGRIRNTAWQVALGWVLTGEDASYAGITPRHPFDLSTHHWGAFQWVGRVGQLDIDNDAFPLAFANPNASASKATEWATGINWFLNKNLRFNVSYSHTSFTGGGNSTQSPGLVTAQPEQVFFTRVQLAF